MKPLPKPELITPGHFYKAETSSGKLERYLINKGIPWIGDIDLRTKTHKIKEGHEKGEVRPGGLDLNPRERAERTLFIKKLSREGLAKAQDYEARFLTRFLTFDEISRIIKEPASNPESIPQKQYESLIEFNNQHRPPNTKTFETFPVPAYFLYDVEFDGMIYHHAWDRLVYDQYLEFEIEAPPARIRDRIY